MKGLNRYLAAVSTLATCTSWVLALNTMASTTSRQERMNFTFVHPSIAAVLSCCKEQQSSKQDSKQQWEVDPVSLHIRPCSPETPETETISNEILIEIAHQCDEAVFSSQEDELPFCKSLQGLVHMGFTEDPSHILVASLLGINQLESAIRKTTGHCTGRAPLLKNMLSQLPNKELAPVLKTLLLPTPGLNLRNLLWHGCVAALPRPWLALILILTFQLGNNHCAPQHKNESLPTLVQLNDYPAMAPVLDRGQEILKMKNNDFLDTVKGWLSVSHHGLWDLSVTWIKDRQSPACAAAILSILLEHGIRQDWCRINNCPQDAFARPGAYFVTLDGHGQRHQHNLLLHPYVVTPDSSHVVNGLLTELGGATIALLTDLFCSSCGGPNIRAALAHGLWDSYLEPELVHFGRADDATQQTMNEEGLWDMIGAMCVAMEGAAHSPSSELCHYRPNFSFTAATRRNADEALAQLHCLEQLRASEQLGCISAVDHVDDLSQLHVSLKFLEVETEKILELCCDGAGVAWGAKDVLAEHDCNVQLTRCTAARTLLSDVATATAMHTDILEKALHDEKGDNLTSRHRKQLQRLCTATEVASTVYSFLVYVALLSIHQQLHTCEERRDSDGTSLSPKVLLKGVERSRMCVSTMSTFLTTNSERAFKAAKEYARGKAVKAILQQEQTIGQT